MWILKKRFLYGQIQNRCIRYPMVLAALIGFAVDAGLSGSGFGGAILFAMVVGFACVIYVLDNRER